MRNDEKVESVALIYMLNNYYKKEYSAIFNTTSNEEVKYAVTSYKNPNTIAHEFLHLFDLVDMYNTKFKGSDSIACKVG